MLKRIFSITILLIVISLSIGCKKEENISIDFNKGIEQEDSINTKINKDDYISINVADYVSLNITGGNNHGLAKINSDRKLLKNDLIKNNIEENKALDASDVDFKIDKNDFLSNGDEISLNGWINKQLTEYCVYLYFEPKTFLVENLEEGEKIDLFKDIVVDFIGESPLATIEITNNSTNDFIKRVEYTTTENYVALGDVVTIIANYKKETASKNNYIIESDTKEYVVEGCGKYITSYNEVKNTDFIKEYLTMIDKDVQTYHGGLKYIDNYKLHSVYTIYSMNNGFYTDGVEMKQYYNSSLFIYEVDFHDDFGKNTRLIIVPLYQV